MRILVLGGLGLQGRAAVYDLARSEEVGEVICADAGPAEARRLPDFLKSRKVKLVSFDASRPEEMASLFKGGVDAAIDLLPLPFMESVFEAAVEAGVNLVSTNYAPHLKHLHARAAAAGCALLPECGFDPGIDLVIFGRAVKRFDEVHVLRSYAGGIPEKAACDNPLNYKISWNWDMVLRSQMRQATFIKNGQRFVISAERQHDAEWIHQIDFPRLGALEAIPNGDAAFYVDLLGLAETIKETGRYSLRWPGWAAFWRPMKALGFLSDEPAPELPANLSPRQFLVRFLEPRLRYQDHQKDLALMQNLFEGLQGGRPKRVVINMLLERDLKTGLLAMNLAVGYPASVAAQMLAAGQIKKKGFLSPVTDLPFEEFMAQLGRRGIRVEEEEAWLD